MKRQSLNRRLAESIKFSPRFSACSLNEARNVLNSQKYDAILVGSDEVLRSRPSSVFCDGTHETLALLRDVDVPIKILVSPSVGVRSFREFDQRELKTAHTALKEFSLFSARDRQTYEFLTNCLGDSRIKVNRVPDPTTFLPLTLGNPSPLSVWLRRLKGKNKLVGFRMPPTPETKAVLEKFECQGFKAVSLTSSKLGFPSISNYFSLQDFPEMFREFDLIISSSFHECLFALKNGVHTMGVDFEQHRVEENTRMSKIKDLFEQLGITEYYCNCTGTKGELADSFLERTNLDKLFDRNAVQSRIRQWGIEFKSYCQIVAQTINSF